MTLFSRLVRMAIILLCVLFSSGWAMAQVVINPHPVAGFQFSSKDMLNFDVVYSKTETVKVQYDVVLQDASGGLVVKYTSATHDLRPGGNVYTPTSFSIANVQYFNKTIAGIENTTKFLPSGDYTWCISIRCVDLKEVCERTLKYESNYSACADAHAEPVTPLLLSFPEDESEIEDKRPTFTWIPPMPIGNDPNMVYTITLVKMLDNQTAEDAIRRNRALYTQNGIKNISLMFPNQLEDLEAGEHYAWQVSAHIGEQHIATSDVWEFEIKEEERISGFIELKPRPSSEFIECSRHLAFAVNKKYAHSKELKYVILKANNEVVMDQHDLFELSVSEGSNQFVVELDDLDLESGFYVLRVYDKNGVAGYIRFKYKPLKN